MTVLSKVIGENIITDLGGQSRTTVRLSDPAIWMAEVRER